MKELKGKTAVVTGGGSGIGRGMALAFADAGMQVVVADIEPAAAEKVRAEVEERGSTALALQTDVTDRGAVDALADRAFAELGGVHLLCNNAGVTTFAPMHRTPDSDWDWVIDVNLKGVVNGLQAFLPRMKKLEGEKHVVNTASIAGISPNPRIAPYVASKYAVVGISETLRMEGEHYQLSCSVLCPGNVDTQILGSERNRPGGAQQEVDPRAAAAIQEGMDALEVGRIVRDAVVNDELYVITHPELRDRVAERNDELMAAFDRAAERAR